MFAKSYRVKTNSALKNSEKKHLIQRIQQEFPNVTDEKAKELVPNKSTANCVKIMTNSGDQICVYSVDNIPIIIDAHDKFYPTVCALWKVPDMIPSITIHEPIVDKLKSGVPLYVPGVIVPSAGRGFPLFPIGATVAVNSDMNSAAAAVGKAVLSSSNIIMSTAGVCLETLHVIGDYLCREAKFNKIERPNLGPPTYGDKDGSEQITVNMQQMKIDAPKPREDWPTLGKPANQVVTDNHTVWEQPNHIASVPSSQIVNNDESMDVSEIEEDFPTDMDELLRFCLLSFMKLEGKKTQLPLRTNLLYRNHMVPLCPPNRSLDVKKSSYKKMSKFLEAMQKEGLIQVQLIEKGVEALTGMALSHPSVYGHYVPEAVITQVEESRREPEDPEGYVAPSVREMFSVTANIQDLFAPLRKGTLVTPAEVRTAIADYVKRNNLQSEDQPGQVRVNPFLAKVTGKDGLVSWEELSLAVQGKMTACTEMRFADGTIRTNKSRLLPIKMNVATRSGNKKVTLVSNLEEFGFSLSALGKAFQHSLSVSSTVTRTAGSSTDQLMLQGDQTYFITKTLIEKYHIPKKFIEGADKMLKKKK